MKYSELTEYTLLDTFGCPEKPSSVCPTFLERDVHNQFKNALHIYNIVVVYGESRQGKTWTIERYCPNQIRIGCQTDMTLEDKKNEMLNSVNANSLEIEHTISEEYLAGINSNHSTELSAEAKLSIIGTKMTSSAGMKLSESQGYREEIKTKYNSFDKNNLRMIINILKEQSQGRFFVFDNFHYLPPSVQQSFCALLKEFNYAEIKVIIVGVWKDASKITALAPDLLNRCQHINIGTWSEYELKRVLSLGEKALNISFSDEIKESFINCSVNNIGIFKDIVQRFLISMMIEKTQKDTIILSDSEKAQKSIDQIAMEFFTPLRDRLINLALPQKKKNKSKHLRLKIVISILLLLKSQSANRVESGFSPTEIKHEIDILCKIKNEPTIDISNITQELGKLHLREENRQTKNNFISLFYYDKAKKKLLILEPTLYAIKAYNVELIDRLISDLHEMNN